MSKRLRCTGCGEVRSYPMLVAPPAVKEGVDPYFGRPLFLATAVRGHLLWAANVEHLALLRDYLAATLRKRSLHPHHMTMMARLPRWMKAAGARSLVDAALADLASRAAKAGIA